jgi:hypothetical protein
LCTRITCAPYALRITSSESPLFKDDYTITFSLGDDSVVCTLTKADSGASCRLNERNLLVNVESGAMSVEMFEMPKATTVAIELKRGDSAIGTARCAPPAPTAKTHGSSDRTRAPTGAA